MEQIWAVIFWTIAFDSRQIHSFMLKHIFTILSIIVANVFIAQTPELIWSGVYADQNAIVNQTTHVSVDSESNVFTLSRYAGTVDYDMFSGTNELTSVGMQSAAIVKHNPDGTIAWAHSYGAQDMHVQFDQLFIDNDDNLYAIGNISCGVVDFDLSIQEAIVAGEMSENTIVIVKISNDGDFISLKTMQMHPYGGLVHLEFLEDGSIVGCGQFEGTVDLDLSDASTFMSSQPSGLYNSFICKWNSDFSLVWAKQIACSDNFNFSQVATDLKIDSNGNIIVVGNFSNHCDFDPGAGQFFMEPVAFQDNPDFYVLKLNASGEFLWAKQLGGGTSELNIHVNLDADDNIYLVGNFQASFDIDPGPNTTTLESSNISDALFISKWSPDANFIWGKSIYSNSSNTLTTATLASSNALWLGGRFIGTVDFNPSSNATNELVCDQNSGYLLHLDLDGNYVWAGGIISSTNAIVNQLHMEDNGQMVIAGTYMSTMDLHPGAETVNYTSTEGEESFVAKLQFTTSDIAHITTSSNLNLFPNPCTTALTIELPNSNGGTLEVYSVDGKMVMSSNNMGNKRTLEISHLTNGIYTIKFIQNGNMEVGRFVKG
jgi:hypothetical protein